MKKKSTSAAVAVIVASLTASLAPVPAKSTMLPATAVELKAESRVSTALTFELASGLVYLPLDEAADYLSQLNSSQRFLLSALIQERQGRGKGGLCANPKEMKKDCLGHLEHYLRVKEAVKLVMHPDNLSRQYPDDLAERANYKADLLRFGRAVAQGEFILRDLISAIDQSKVAEKTVRLTDMPDDADVKAMITAEHKKLGLSAPEFS